MVSNTGIFDELLLLENVVDWILHIVFLLDGCVESSYKMTPEESKLLQEINTIVTALSTEFKSVKTLVLDHRKELYGEGSYIGLRAIVSDLKYKEENRKKHILFIWMTILAAALKYAWSQLFP